METASLAFTAGFHLRLKLTHIAFTDCALENKKQMTVSDCKGKCNLTMFPGETGNLGMMVIFRHALCRPSTETRPLKVFRDSFPTGFPQHL